MEEREEGINLGLKQRFNDDDDDDLPPHESTTLTYIHNIRQG